MANWGADFWGAYSDVAKARMAQAAYAQQQAGMSAFGNAMTDPNIFMPTPQGGPQPDAQGAAGGMVPYENAIASIESGGGRGRAPNYTAIGPRTKTGDRAYGRYQVMGNNVGPWTQEALGRRETPQQFLQDPQAQNAVFDKRFGGYIKQTGSPQDAASMWFTGRPLAQGRNARDVNGMSGQSYADAFTKALGQTPGQVVGTASAISGQRPGQLSWQHIVQAIQAKNPGLAPAALAEAVQLFEPLMSQQSQMDWREQTLALREMTEANRETIAQDRLTQGDERIKLAEDKAAAVQKRFDITQDWKVKGFDERKREFELKYQQAVTKEQKDSALKQMKYFSDQHHQRVMELLAGGNARLGQGVDDETKKLVDEENARYEQEQQEIAAKGQQGSSQQPYKPGDQHAVPKGAVYAPGTKPLGGGDSGSDTPPASYTGDPALWKYMKPEDRKLWQ